jgi:hypothetical protein
MRESKYELFAESGKFDCMRSAKYAVVSYEKYNYFLRC